MDIGIKDSSAKPARVLIVEDNPDQAALMERWLANRANYEVVVAADGLTGSKLATEGGFDLVLSDIELPGCNGLEVLRASKAAWPDTPALLLTAHSSVDYAVAALRGKADELLFKPLVRDEVLSKADAMIAAARKRRESRPVVLAIGAHFDDVEIGVGGSLLRHAASGHKVVVLVLTDSSVGGNAEQRRQEGLDACARMGAVLETAGLPDTRMTDGFETISAISAVIRKYSPTILYTHTEHDVHQDHRHAARASLVAARTVPNVYCYQTPSTTTSFLPSCFVDIDAHVDRKIELLAAFASQAARPYLAPDMVRASARYWGRFSNYHHVEALEVVRAAGSVFAEQQAS